MMLFFPIIFLLCVSSCLSKTYNEFWQFDKDIHSKNLNDITILTTYNKDYAPFLRSEIGFAQLLAMRFVYWVRSAPEQLLPGNPDTLIDSYVQYTYDGITGQLLEEDDYASQYRIMEVFKNDNSLTEGIKLSPTDPESQKKDIILFFGKNTDDGTAQRLANVFDSAEKMFHTDIPRLERWVMEAEKNGRGIGVFGHCLGGALAQQFFGKVLINHPRVLQHSKLIVFNSLGVSNALAHKMADFRQHMVNVINYGDPIPFMFGKHVEKTPTLKYYHSKKYVPSFSPETVGAIHGKAGLVEFELNNEINPVITFQSLEVGNKSPDLAKASFYCGEGDWKVNYFKGVQARLFRKLVAKSLFIINRFSSKKKKALYSNLP
eukprot:Pgem_evm1s5705